MLTSTNLGKRKAFNTSSHRSSTLVPGALVFGSGKASTLEIQPWLLQPIELHHCRIPTVTLCLRILSSVLDNDPGM